MPTTPNLGLTIPVGGTTPGANNNTTPGTYPYSEAANLELIDSECFSENNPVPTSGLDINANVPFNGYSVSNANNGQFSGNVSCGTFSVGGVEVFAGFGTAPPTSGTYALGALFLNTNPVPGGNWAWICTTAGTPGTWKAVGPISI